MAAVDTPSGKARDHWLQMVVAVAISVAGLGTSWSGYQAALWNGAQTVHYGKANAARVVSAQAALRAATVQVWQVGLLSAWLQAKESGQERLASVYEQRLPPDLKPAFDEWSAQHPLENPNAAPSPFRLPSYRNPGVEEAAALERKADAEFEAGQQARRTAEAFTRGMVILAMAMFFGGIVQVFDAPWVRTFLCAMSVLACLWGLGQVFALPILTLAAPG